MTEWRTQARVLGAAPGLEIVDVVCLTAPRAFCPPVAVPGLRLGLPRSGGYVRRVGGREEFMDATVGFLMRPGEETANAHPHGCGDRGTMFRLDQDAFGDLLDHLPVHESFATPGPLDLRHRALVAACTRGIDEFEIAERFHDLGPTSRRVPGTWRQVGGRLPRSPSTGWSLRCASCSPPASSASA